MDFLSQDSNIVVFGIVLIIWVVVFFFLAGIDKRLTKLEKE